MKRRDVLATGFVALDVIWLDKRDRAGFATGGSCGNVSATVSAFGHDVALVARLGDDPEAAFVSADLENVGVAIDHVRRDASVGTPVVIHHVLPDGDDHRFLFVDPASGLRLPRYSPLEDQDVWPFLQAPAPKVFYFDRLSPTIVALAKWAKQNGSLTFFEPSDVEPGVAVSDVEPWVDILKISAQRAHEFVGRFRFSSPIQILTDGRRGLDVRMGGHEDPELHHLPAVPVSCLIDSAGAGDAVSSLLIGTILDGWTGELPTPDLLIHGIGLSQSLAALNCTFPGARGALRELGVTDVQRHLAYTIEASSAQTWCNRIANRADGESRSFIAPFGLERRYALERFA